MAEDPRTLVARARFEKLANRLFEPLRRSMRLDLALLAATAIGALLVAGQTHQLVPSVLFACGGSLLAAAVSWWWLAYPAKQAAYEVLIDHANRERQEWESRTGTKLPGDVADAEQWLRNHPDKPGQAVMLTRLGRLDEARADLRRKDPATAVEAPHVDVFLRQLDLYDGDQPESDDLHERWQALPESAERGLRRGCLATLDAQIAADRAPTAEFAEEIRALMAEYGLR